MNKLFLISLIMFLLSAVNVFAATNVSVLYGYNGSSIVPIRVDAQGRLMTTMNLTKSTGMFPAVDNAYDLGDLSLRWKILYVMDIVAAGSINVAGSVFADNFTIVDTNGSLYQPVYGTDDDLVLYLPFKMV